jgi:hypothetical protein
MESEPKKGYWVYTGDTKIVDISSDREDSRAAKIDFMHRVRTLCTVYIVKSSKSTVVPVAMILKVNLSVNLKLLLP